MDFASAGAIVAASFVASMALCRVVLEFARRRRLVDVPNERSLHKIPTPRLGGIAIVTTALLAIVIALVWSGTAITRELEVWLLGATAIAALGLIDDVKPLPARTRMLIQLVIAAGAVAWTIGDAPVLLPGGPVALAKPVVIALATIYVVGLTNIFNFMDGMDGLASSQAIGVALVMAITAFATGNVDVGIVALAIAGATSGFLTHNAPPASMFMGDAGSTFLGFSFALLGCILASRPTPVPALVSILGLSPFLLDGTFTILRRASRGERIWEAHRTHLYQRAAATGVSHREVLMIYLGWIALTGALALQLRSTATVIAAIAITLAAFVGVWRWIVARESTQA